MIGVRKTFLQNYYTNAGYYSRLQHSHSKTQLLYPLNFSLEDLTPYSVRHEGKAHLTLARAQGDRVGLDTLGTVICQLGELICGKMSQRQGSGSGRPACRWVCSPWGANEDPWGRPCLPDRVPGSLSSYVRWGECLRVKLVSKSGGLGCAGGPSAPCLFPLSHDTH